RSPRTPRSNPYVPGKKAGPGRLFSLGASAPTTRSTRAARGRQAARRSDVPPGEPRLLVRDPDPLLLAPHRPRQRRPRERGRVVLLREVGRDKVPQVRALEA